eukprot:6084924-Alexandrium_andersonii.AAC.1
MPRTQHAYARWHRKRGQAWRTCGRRLPKATSSGLCEVSKLKHALSVGPILLVPLRLVLPVLVVVS